MDATRAGVYRYISSKRLPIDKREIRLNYLVGTRLMNSSSGKQFSSACFESGKTRVQIDSS